MSVKGGQAVAPIPALLGLGAPVYPMLSSGAHPALAGVFYTSGNYTGDIGAAVASPTDTLRAHPIILTRTGRLVEVGFRMTINGGAGSRARVGLYIVDPVSLMPTRLIFDSGSLVTDAGAPILRTAVASIQIVAPTILFAAYNATVAAPTVASCVNTAGQVAANFFGVGVSGNRNGSGITIASLYGPLPATFPVFGAVNFTSPATVPSVFVRYA